MGSLRFHGISGWSRFESKSLFLDSDLGIPEESFHARLRNHNFVLMLQNIEVTINDVTLINSNKRKLLFLIHQIMAWSYCTFNISPLCFQFIYN